MRLVKLNTSGDTIIEVLVSIIVVSTVLGAAFAASSRSQKSIQQAHEHSIALKTAESQVELLRSSSSLGSSEIFDSALTMFCMNKAGKVVKDLKTISGPAPLLTPFTNITDYGTCATGSPITYKYGIDRKTVATDQYVYTVKVRWDSIQRNGQDEVSLVFKADKP